MDSKPFSQELPCIGDNLCRSGKQFAEPVTVIVKSQKMVIPAQTGILELRIINTFWIPACAGLTRKLDFAITVRARGGALLASVGRGRVRLPLSL